MVGSRLLHLKDETVIALIWKAHEGGPAISLSACDGESVWTCIVDVVLKPKVNLLHQNWSYRERMRCSYSNTI